MSPGGILRLTAKSRAEQWRMKSDESYKFHGTPPEGPRRAGDFIADYLLKHYPTE